MGKGPFCAVRCPSLLVAAVAYLTFGCLLPHAARRSLGKNAVTPDPESDVSPLHHITSDSSHGYAPSLYDGRTHGLPIPRSQAASEEDHARSIANLLHNAG